MMKMLTLAAFLPAILLPATLQAEEVVTAQMRTGWQTASGTHMTALHLMLAPDWKTYWRSPGDSGIPPQFDWAGSDNLASVQFHWPRPHVFTLNGLETIGYKTELVLPIEVTAVDPARPVQLRASVDLGVCSDVCVPATLTIAAELSGKGAADPAIAAALKARPDTAAEGGLRGIGCTVAPTSDGLRLTATLDLPAAGGAETVVIEAAGDGLWVSGAVVTRAGGHLTAVADLVPPGGAPFALDRGQVTLTVLGRDRAVEINGCPAP